MVAHLDDTLFWVQERMVLVYLLVQVLQYFSNFNLHDRNTYNRKLVSITY